MSQTWQLVVVTGASRGFGREIAAAFGGANRLPLHLVLVARNANDLADTVQHIRDSSFVRNASKDFDECTLIDTVVADLSDLSTLEANAEVIFGANRLGDRAYDKVIFINNAGSLGPLKMLTENMDVNTLKQINDFNVTSCCYLSGEFARRAKEGMFSSSCKKAIIVNISSLAALKAFVSWGVYCSGKAARNMYHCTLAEEADKSINTQGNLTLKVLNYAPGPLDTDMQREIREAPQEDPETREYFRTMKSENRLIDPSISAKKMVRIVYAEAFKNGEHVDFYDSVAGIDTESAATTCCACSYCTCGVDCKCKSIGKPACDSCFDDIVVKRNAK